MEDREIILRALDVYKAQLMDIACSPAWFPSEKARAKRHHDAAIQCQRLIDTFYRISVAELGVDSREEM